MPKGFSDNEKLLINKAIIKSTIELIREKGMKKTTVEDITKKSHISKGSFYSFYNSKEDLFMKIIRDFETVFVEETNKILLGEGDKKEKIKKALNEIYLSKDSIALYINEDDITYLRRKFTGTDPHEDIEGAKEKYEKIFSYFNMELSNVNIETASIIMRTLQLTVENKEGYSKEAQERGLGILVEAFAKFMVGEI